MQAYKQCQKCSTRGEWRDRFCRSCGGAMQEVTPPPMVGESPTKGTYRITITMERVFRHQDHAEECAGKSMLGEDEIRFSDIPGSKIDVKFIKTAVGRDTHPWVCRYCRDEEQHEYTRKNPYVSHTDKGICENCGQQDWVKR